jgi:transglutaminase-like putative cysteine protease
MTMVDRQDKPNLLVYVAYLGVFAFAINTVFLVLPNDQMKWYLLGTLVIAVMTGVVLSHKWYVALGLILDIAGLLTFVYYAWQIFADKEAFGTYLGEMLSVMLVLRTFKLFRNHDFILPLVISLTLVIFAAIPSFSAEFVYNLFGFLLFLGLALFLGNIDEFARLPRQRRRKSALVYTYDFLHEYKPVPLSKQKPVQLMKFIGPALGAGIPAVAFSFLASSSAYFTVEHNQAPGSDLTILSTFEGQGTDNLDNSQTDLLTGMRMGGFSQHYVGFDDDFDISMGRLVENSTSTKVVMEVESNLPSYWRGKAFDIYTGRGWQQSPDIVTTSWSLDPPAGDRSLYGGQVMQAEVSSAGIKPDPEIFKDEIRQEFFLETNLPGIVFAAYQPVELKMPIPAVKIDDMFDLVSPPASDSMVAGQTYEVVSRKSYASRDDLNALDYKLEDLEKNEPDFYGRYTSLPERGTLENPQDGFNFSRIRAKAYEITAGKGTVYDKVASLERWLMSDFKYSLSPPAAVPDGVDAVDYFLFDWKPKRGHCEYFSSALAVLCRSIGIPARVVTGYAPGNYNVLKNRYIVEEHHAHAWVEVYWPDVGWVEFDAVPQTWYQGLGEGISGAWVTFHNTMEELYVYNPRGYFRDKVFPTLARAWMKTRYFMGQRELDFYETLDPVFRATERNPVAARWLLASACGLLLASVLIRRKSDTVRNRREVIRECGRRLAAVGKRLKRMGVSELDLATEVDYASRAMGISGEWGTAVAELVEKYQVMKYSGREVSPAEIRNLKKAGRAVARAPRV